jgi:Mrp family chromosome partitioning ATPase
MLIDLPPGNWRYSSFNHARYPTGAVVVSTPQAVALADKKKGIHVFV